MTRGKQKIDAQRRNAERNQKSKGSQLEARAEGLKVVCPICKTEFYFRENNLPHDGFLRRTVEESEDGCI
nr:unnamed protein product [Digitaria exilis]